MRKEYGKALRTLFAEGMQKRLGDWRPVPAPAPWYWPGERLYMHPAPEGMWLLILLEPDIKDHDAFSLSVGWSRLSRAPQLSMRPAMEAPRSAQALMRDEYLCPLPQLIPQRPCRDGRLADWLIDPRSASCNPLEVFAAFVERQQARLRLAPLVEDALNALVEWGLPYLEQVLAQEAPGQAPTMLSGDAPDQPRNQVSKA